jgi:hypothetical protein
MLIIPARSEVAMVRDRFGMGAARVPGAGTRAVGGTAAASPLPRAGAVTAASASGQAVSAAQCAAANQAVTKQQISQQDAHTTRDAAASGGAVGPHSARDPV